MKGRPAETTSAAGAVAVLLAVILGLESVKLVAALTVVVGFIPALVTLLVVNGGIKGVLRMIWQGRR